MSFFPCFIFPSLNAHFSKWEICLLFQFLLILLFFVHNFHLLGLWLLIYLIGSLISRYWSKCGLFLYDSYNILIVFGWLIIFPLVIRLCLLLLFLELNLSIEIYTCLLSYYPYLSLSYLVCILLLFDIIEFILIYKFIY